jgi:hypothetical protein
MKTLCVSYYKENFKILPIIKMEVCVGDKYSKTDHGQATGKLYHLRLRVECTLFCNLQSRARTQAVLVIGLCELLGNPKKNVLTIIILLFEL